LSGNVHCDNKVLNLNIVVFYFASHNRVELEIVALSIGKGHVFSLRALNKAGQQIVILAVFGFKSLTKFIFCFANPLQIALDSVKEPNTLIASKKHVPKGSYQDGLLGPNR